MSISLLDQNKRPLQDCNAADESGTHYFVQDVASFNNFQTSLEHSKNITMMLGIALVVFLCIFSLNFTSSGWTAGNLLTFGIVVASLYFLTQYGRQWNHNHTMVNQMLQQGVPCVKTEQESKIVYCSRPSAV